MMLTTDPNSIAQKRDLHVGGLGAGATGALAAVADPMKDAAMSWAKRAQQAARDADNLVHDNPYAALAVIGLLGLTAGYLLARR